MTDLVIKYPFDPTGVSTDNLVQGEEHTLPQGEYRAIALDYGPFYTQGLVVRDVASGERLTPGSQFKAIELVEEAVIQTGLEACAILVVTDPDVSDSISADYQVVGGQFSTSVDAIRQLIENLDLDNRSIEWAMILDKPAAYPPTGHLHSINDVYGWQYVVDAIRMVKDAILTGDRASHEELFIYIDEKLENLQTDGVREEDFNQHVENKENPHQVTKSQVGLSQVQNYTIATESQAKAGDSNSAYMTPLRTKQAVQELVGSAISDHTENNSNPHGVSKGQVGLSNVENFTIASVSEAQDGSVNNRYMTPMRVNNQILFLRGRASGLAPLDDQGKIAKAYLPNLTKSDVGLANVQNYAMATRQQMLELNSSSLYVSPQRVADALNKFGLKDRITIQAEDIDDAVDRGKYFVTGRFGPDDMFNDAYLDVDNNSGYVSHIAVNAANGKSARRVKTSGSPWSAWRVLAFADQIAGQINKATEAQATGATNDTAYMTPLKTAQQIAATVGQALTQHAEARNNPHQVTKGQVGLGSVQNFAIATETEARDGNAQNKYLTPYLASLYVGQQKQWIDAAIDAAGISPGSEDEDALVRAIRRLGGGNMPVGIPFAGPFESELPNCIFLDGDLHYRTAIGDLWNHIQNYGKIVTDTDWVNMNLRGLYSFGNNSTTVRVPDMRGVYPRGWPGKEASDMSPIVPVDSVPLGRFDTDKFRSHSHPVEKITSRGGGGSGGNIENSWAGESTRNLTPSQITIGNTGADETAPKTVWWSWQVCFRNG